MQKVRDLSQVNLPKKLIFDEDNIQTCKCSICGRMVDIANREFNKFPYCHCGAKMKGGEEE